MYSAAADFIEALVEDGFLDNGVIVVVSGHRAMTFVSHAEQQHYGRGAVSRIPGFILARDIQGQSVEVPFHQADIMPTLLQRSGSRMCERIGVRDMLQPEATNPLCLLHARGDWRDRVDVFCPDGEGTVQVDGDDSRFIESMGLTSERQQIVLDTVARYRLGLLPVPMHEY